MRFYPPGCDLVRQRGSQLRSAIGGHLAVVRASVVGDEPLRQPLKAGNSRSLD